MDRFERVREYGSGVNRNVWLVLGALVIVGLIVATFVYGRSDDAANRVADEEGRQEQAADGQVEEGRAAQRQDEGGERAGDEAGGATVNEPGNDQETVADETAPGGRGSAPDSPGSLANTGVGSTGLPLMVIAAAGYLWQRSRRQLRGLRQMSF